MNYQTVLFDFDGVLCKDKFYIRTLLPDYQEVYDWIEMNIFSDKELVRQWMRNQINSDDINKLVVQGTGIDREVLSKYYTDSIRKMELNAPVEDLAKSLKKRGCKIGIVTDNMDVFTQITVPNHQLNNLFDVIVNSADYGLLKKEENGKLFDVALSVLNEDIKNCLMIDDSVSTVELFKTKGGGGLVYKNDDDLNVLQ